MATPPTNLQGVILAAGKGTRIRPFSDHYPKPLLPVFDRPLLLWQVEAMRELGITDILIVIGHLGHRVVQSLGDGSEWGVQIRYVEQEKTLGIAHAVGQLEPHLDHPFLLFLGDIFFETKALGSMLDAFNRDGVDAVLAVKVEEDREAMRRNFSVELGEDGFVSHVVEKPRHPRTNLKGCGLYLFDTSIFDAVRATPRTALRDEYELTTTIELFVQGGHGIVPAEVIEADLNLSAPPDLLDLNLHVMRQRGLDNHIAEGAKVESGAQITNSVIMAGATVKAGAVLDECLVLPGEVISAGRWKRSIFASGQEVSCLG
ncbi:MAG: sugar phosphate nucleotidyltransferase [Planctomycetota bacterium]|nr:sugar phosphate nucleotidyltransferase [Planctomycetota bacterium]MDG2142637.1 sugar phosphate nucleotidyltransferase [Planctomycetota bacterium]